MRTKSLQEPTGVETGHEWLSPVGHSEFWHRIWNGTAWENHGAAEDSEEEDQDEDEETGEDEAGAEDSDETETEADVTTTEETNGERATDTSKVPDGDRNPEGSGARRQPAPRGAKQGKGGKGKRK